MYMALSLVMMVLGAIVVGATVPEPYSYFLAFVVGAISGFVGCVLQDILG